VNDESSGGEGRQHERQHRQRRDGHRGRRGALLVEAHGVVSQRADQDREPDEPVHRDHHRGEHGVPRERLGLRSAGARQRDDERDLDHRDRDGEHERPERLPHPVRDDLGVVHRGEDRPGEHHGDDDDRHRAEVVHDERRHEHEGSDDRRADRPGPEDPRSHRAILPPTPPVHRRGA
jgi:hypothetical protein